MKAQEQTSIALRAERWEGDRKLEVMKSTIESSWSQVKAEADNVWDALKGSLSVFKAHFKRSISSPIRVRPINPIIRGSIDMKRFNRFAIFFSAFLLASLLGCASTTTQEGAGEYVDDTVITAKVKGAIFNDPSLKSAEINVETFKGVVQLSGFVNSGEDIDKAVRLARDVPGVVSVKNDMRHK